MLRTSETTPNGFQNGAQNHADYAVAKVKKTLRTNRKIKEGTDGISALDEIDDSERLREGFEMCDNDRW